MIHLTDEERKIIWYALAWLKDYYEENNRREEAEQALNLLRLLNLSDQVIFKISKDLTEDGIKELQWLQKNREKGSEPSRNVVLFPKGRVDQEDIDPLRDE